MNRSLEWRLRFKPKDEVHISRSGIQSMQRRESDEYAGYIQLWEQGTGWQAQIRMIDNREQAEQTCIDLNAKLHGETK